MTRAFYFVDDQTGKLLTAEEFRAKQTPKGKSCGVITDSMDALEHPADGKFYDSKSVFRQVTKDLGYIEIGNEKQTYREKEIPDPSPHILRMLDRCGFRD